MPIVSTDMLKEGMTLDAPVKNTQGQVLFGSGHVLKEKHITMMMAWGIPEASVSSPEGEDPEEARRYQQLVMRMEQAIRPRFRRCDGSQPLVSETIRCVAELMARKDNIKPS